MRGRPHSFSQGSRGAPSDRIEDLHRAAGQRGTPSESGQFEDNRELHDDRAELFDERAGCRRRAPSGQDVIDDDDALTAVLREQITTTYHPAGTAPMGRADDERAVVDAHGIRQRFIKPHCPWTNGKVERLNRTLATEWAYARPWTSNDDRRAGLTTWLDHYNLDRHHLGIGGLNPIDRINNGRGQYS